MMLLSIIAVLGLFLLIPATVWLYFKWQDIHDEAYEEGWKAGRNARQDVIPETVFGYPTKKLILFAMAVERKGILPDDIENFVRNFQCGYDAGLEEFRLDVKLASATVAEQSKEAKE